LAQTFGAPKPDWYIFPFSRTKKPVDPQQPATSRKRVWETVRNLH
jgi:hypothetical protein